VKYKLFKVQITSSDDAQIFVDWIHGIQTPFHLQVNNGTTYTFENDIQKLFWLSGFESLIDSDYT
jgi:hypothetical protein